MARQGAFESYEISPCRNEGEHDIVVTTPLRADFWTLYGRRDGCSEAIADFDTLAQATEVYMAITGFSLARIEVARYLRLPDRR
jgi:hypothetical protein